MSKTDQANRAGRVQVGQVYRSRVGAQVERCAAGESKQFRIRGVANTFRAMHSGRIFHPDAFTQYLADSSGAIDLPLLANHGETPGFASIGRVDAVKVEAGRGMVFEAFIGEGTGLTDEARSLIDQKILKEISIGWVPSKIRYANATDKDLPQWLGDEFKRTGRGWLDVIEAADLVEISVVDVADDGGARIAAQLDRAQARIAELEAQLGGSRGDASEDLSADEGLDLAESVFAAAYTDLSPAGDLADVLPELAGSMIRVRAAIDDVRNALQEGRKAGASAEARELSAAVESRWRSLSLHAVEAFEMAAAQSVEYARALLSEDDGEICGHARAIRAASAPPQAETPESLKTLRNLIAAEDRRIAERASPDYQRRLDDAAYLEEVRRTRNPLGSW